MGERNGLVTYVVTCARSDGLAISVGHGQIHGHAGGGLEDGVVACILMTSDNDWAGRGEGKLLARLRELGPELGEVRVDHLLGERLEGDLGRPAQELLGLGAVADQ